MATLVFNPNGIQYPVGTDTEEDLQNKQLKTALAGGGNTGGGSSNADDLLSGTVKLALIPALPISKTTGLQAALDGKSNVGHSQAATTITGLAPVATSGAYTDLSGKPTLFDGAYTSLSGKPTLFDGAYASLSGKPAIPTAVSALTNDSGFQTSSQVTTSVSSALTASQQYLDETTFTGDGSSGNPFKAKAGRGFTPKGAWTASTTYAVDDLLTSNGTLYRVTTAHTSPASFTTTNLEVWASKGTDGVALSSDYGLYPAMLIETEALALGTANITLTSGSAYTRKVIAPKTGSCTSVQFRVSTAGATLTAGAANNGIAIYDSAGNRLGLADCNTAFTTVGDKSVALDVAVSLVAGSVYYIAVCSTGTTPAILTGTAGSNLINIGQAAPPYNFARVTTGALGTTVALTGGSVVDARGSGRIYIAGF